MLTRIVVEPELPGPKARAIRQLNYDSSTKVLVVTRRRFWETDDGIFGGGTFSDLPTGTTYYPSDNAEAKDPRVSRGPGVLLASYSWGQSARRLASLPHRERVASVLQHLSRIHPQLREPGIVRDSASWSWDNHPYSGGAFAWFMPGQHSSLHRHIISSAGRIYFAGEHASLTHTWMQGALESGVRAVREMLVAAQVSAVECSTDADPGFSASRARGRTARACGGRRSDDIAFEPLENGPAAVSHSRSSIIMCASPGTIVGVTPYSDAVALTSLGVEILSSCEPRTNEPRGAQTGLPSVQAHHQVEQGARRFRS